MNKHLCAYSYSLLLLVLRPYSASCPMNKDLQEVAIDLSEVALGSLTDNEIVKRYSCHRDVSSTRKGDDVHPRPDIREEA